MAIKQFKVKELAANFEMKTKEITDILVSYDISAKKAVLESADLSIVFEYLTRQNQVGDLDSYMYAPKKPEPPPQPVVKPVQPVQTEKKPEIPVKKTEGDKPKAPEAGIKKEIREVRPEAKPTKPPERTAPAAHTRTQNQPRPQHQPQHQQHRPQQRPPFNQPQQSRPNQQQQSRPPRSDHPGSRYGKLEQPRRAGQQ